MADSKPFRQAGKGFQWLVLATVIATYALVVVGAVVRTSGSGLGCPDWPLCQGQVLPVGQLRGTTLVEFSHRFVTTLVTVLVLATAFVAWRRYRQDRWIFRSAMLAVALLGLQIVLGGITVLLELSPAVVGIHLGNALLLFAALLSTAVFAFRPWPARKEPRPRGDSLPVLALASTVGTFILILSGTVVTGAYAGYACPTWPLCNGELLPMANTLTLIAAIHRYIAAGIGLLILYTLAQAWVARRYVAGLSRAAVAASALFALQVIVGALNVLLGFPFAAGLLHVAVAAAVWAAMVVFAILAYQTSGVKETSHRGGHPGGEPVPIKTETGISSLEAADAGPRAAGHVARAETDPHVQMSWRSSALEYVVLTKPWIVGLLLATTLGAMLVAQHGFPGASLLFFTLAGGAMAASGASALNSYLDRDIDVLMGRTSRRPIPSGKISARNALIFGLAMCAGGVILLAAFVNLLSGMLALLGALYYVGVYTLILKRKTPQNVVIGGAAGAIPPMVGWAAVTNQVNLLAVYLFLIIFYWTPPHTWALMLMVKKDYERVHVPMMPVARGEPETRRQIVLYSLLMVAITLIPFSLRDLGVVYFLTALILGARFLQLSVKLWRDQSKRTARQLYYFSNAYLALLFLAMVIDHSALHLVF